MGSQVLSPWKLASQMLPSLGGHPPPVPPLPPHLLVLGWGAERAMGRKGLPDDLAPIFPSFHPVSTLSPTHRSRANPKSPIQSQPTTGETGGEHGNFSGPQSESGVGLPPYRPTAGVRISHARLWDRIKNMTALHSQLQGRVGLTSGHRVRSETGVLAFLPTLRQGKESGGPSSSRKPGAGQEVVK